MGSERLLSFLSYLVGLHGGLLFFFLLSLPWSGWQLFLLASPLHGSKFFINKDEPMHPGKRPAIRVFGSVLGRTQKSTLESWDLSALMLSPQQ